VKQSSDDKSIQPHSSLKQKGKKKPTPNPKPTTPSSDPSGPIIIEESVHVGGLQAKVPAFIGKNRAFKKKNSSIGNLT